MAKVLNIEICDRTISICQTARAGKGVRLYNSFVFPTPGNCVQDGIILNPTLLAGELKLQLSSHRIKQTNNVYFSISSSRIAVREVRFPPMKEKLLAAAIQTNAAEYFPIDLKSYHITYHVLEKASSAKPQSRVIVMAVPISMIESYFQLAEMAGLSIQAIDSSSNSQYQILKKLRTDGVTAFADVGSSSSIISFMRGSELLLQRTFALGADELVSHFMTSRGSIGADYIKSLYEADVTHPSFSASQVLTETEIQKDLEILVGSISRSIDYFNSDQLELAVTRIVLVGLNRHIVGLKDLIAESTGLETLYADDIPEFSQLAGNSADAAAFVNCIGSTISPLNLIPKEAISNRRVTFGKDDSSIASGIVICVLIVVCAVALSMSSWLGYLSASSDMAALQTEIANAQPAAQVYNRLAAFKKSEQDFDSFIASENNPNANLVGFFKELEQKMPSSIQIMSAACTNDGVTMNVSVGSFTEAASVISMLRGFESLASVDISDLTREKNEAGIERVFFTVNCTYGINPYLNKINPYGEFVGFANGGNEPAKPTEANAESSNSADSNIDNDVNSVAGAHEDIVNQLPKVSGFDIPAQ